MDKNLFSLCLGVLILFPCVVTGETCIFNEECVDDDGNYDYDLYCCKPSGSSPGAEGECKVPEGEGDNKKCPGDEVNTWRHWCIYDDYCQTAINEGYYCCATKAGESGECYWRSISGNGCPSGTKNIERPSTCTYDEECPIYQNEINCCCSLTSDGSNPMCETTPRCSGSYSCTPNPTCVFDDECGSSGEFCCKPSDADAGDEGKCRVGTCAAGETDFERHYCYYDDYCQTAISTDYYCCATKPGEKGWCYKDVCPSGTTNIERPSTCTYNDECPIYHDEVDCCCSKTSDGSDPSCEVTADCGDSYSCTPRTTCDDNSDCASTEKCCCEPGDTEGLCYAGTTCPSGKSEVCSTNADCESLTGTCCCKGLVGITLGVCLLTDDLPLTICGCVALKGSNAPFNNATLIA